MFAMFRWVYLILLWVVALMTGLLSLIRELQGIYQPNVIQQRSLFWHSVFVAFIISSAILWIIEHQKVKRLEMDKRSQDPKLNADFNVFAVAPAGIQDRDSIVAITGLITNTGAPSIVKNIRVVVETGGKSIQGQFISLDSRGSRFQEIIDGEPVERIMKFEDHWVRNCSSNPIMKGGGAIGGHVVLLPNITTDDVFRAGTIIMLTFQDVCDKSYEFKKVMSGQIIPPLNPRTLQKRQSE